MLRLPLDFLIGRLLGINATRVKEEARERLLRYQRECYQMLAQAFTRASGDTDSPTLSALAQVREMGLALVRMAE